MPEEHVMVSTKWRGHHRIHPPSETEKKLVREELDIPSNKFIILAVGKVAPIKGFDVLIEACAKLPTAVLQTVQVLTSRRWS